jgi:hypothetical protein
VKKLNFDSCTCTFGYRAPHAGEREGSTVAHRVADGGITLVLKWSASLFFSFASQQEPNEKTPLFLEGLGRPNQRSEFSHSLE